MKRNLSPAQCEKTLNTCPPANQDWQDNLNRRARAIKYRNLLRDHKNMNMSSQAKLLVKSGASKNELAKLTELSVNDIQSILDGHEYPYFKNAWIRIMNEPDDFAHCKLSDEDRLSPDEKFDLLMKRNK